MHDAPEPIEYAGTTFEAYWLAPGARAGTPAQDPDRASSRAYGTSWVNTDTGTDTWYTRSPKQRRRSESSLHATHSHASNG